MKFVQNRRLRIVPQMWIAMACLVVGSFVTLGAVLFFFRQASPIPSSIRRQVSFTIFLPDKGVVIDGTSYKYDQAAKVLSFTGRMQDGQVMTFAEQATPDPFTDVQNFYPQFLHALNQYGSFDSYQGTVYLTHPKNAGQAGVMNAKGTLLFGRVDHDEPQPVWQDVFNNLNAYRQ